MSKNVIVVDDSKFLVKQIVKFFEGELGYTVVATASDGNEAVEMYEKHKPDLITLDITMPNKDGQQALEEIMSANPSANAIMVSAVRGDTMLECMATGAKGYVEKPLKFKDAAFVEEFKSTVEEAFEE